MSIWGTILQAIGPAVIKSVVPALEPIVANLIEQMLLAEIGKLTGAQKLAQVQQAVAGQAAPEDVAAGVSAAVSAVNAVVPYTSSKVTVLNPAK